MDELTEHALASTRPEQTDDAEPTLAVVLRRSALAELPDRLAMLMQLAWPLAAHFAWLGWWLAATGATAAGAFGVWAWCERQLRSEAPAGERALRIARAASGAISAAATAALLMELFFRVMGDAPIS